MDKYLQQPCLMLYFGVVLFLITLYSPCNVYSGQPSEDIIFLNLSENDAVIKAEKAEIGSILKEINKHSGIKVYTASSLLHDLITGNFKGKTVIELFERLLINYNAAFIFSETGPRLTEVWILSRKERISGSNAASYTVNYKQDTIVLMSGKAGNEAMASTADKKRVIDRLTEEGKETAIPVILDFLSDEDSSIRTAAIESLTDLQGYVTPEQFVTGAVGHEDSGTRMAATASGFPIPFHVLVDHILHDPSPHVRREALQAIYDHPDAPYIAKRVIKEDSDAMVRGLAELY